MTPGTIAFVVVFLLAAVYAYLIFPVWVAVSCANTTMTSTRVKLVWFIACVVFAPVGSWAYCLLTPQRRHFRLTSWLSLVGTIALVVFVSRFTAAQAELVKQRVTTAESLVRIAKMDPDGVQRTAIMADLDTLRRETRGGVMAFTQNTTTAALLDLLDVYADDDHISLFEGEDWIEQFKLRRVTSAAALEQRIQAGPGRLP